MFHEKSGVFLKLPRTNPWIPLLRSKRESARMPKEIVGRVDKSGLILAYSISSGRDMTFFFRSATMTTTTTTVVYGRNEIETQFVVRPLVASGPALALARVSPSRNHHAITLIRLSFIFRSPFPSPPPPPFPIAAQTSLRLPSSTTLESTNFEVSVGFLM